MSAPVMRPVPVTGTGVVINEAFDSSLANQQDLLVYGQALETRLGKIEKAIQPVGGIDLNNVDAGSIFTYSALGVAYWTTATRRASTILGSPNADTGGGIAIDVTEGAAPGTNRIAVLQPWDLTAALNTATRWGVTVFDIDAAGTFGTAIVARALFAGENAYSQLQASGFSYQAVGVKFVGPNQLKAQTASLYPTAGATISGFAVGNYGKHAFTTLTLDAGAGTLTVAEDGFVATLPRFNNDAAVPFVGRHRRRSHKIGAYGLATPFSWPAPGNISQPGYMLSERVGFGQWNPFQVGGFTANHWFSEVRLTDELFAVLHEGRSPSSGGFGGRLSLVRVNDNMAGEVATKVTSQPVAGNVRLGALSPTLLVGGWTTAGVYSTYLFSRDADHNVLDGAGVAVNQGEGAIIPVEYIRFSPTKYGAIRISAGRIARITMISVDPTVQAPGNPFTALGFVTLTLTSTVAGSVDGDSVTILAVERLGPDRILVASRNNTRNAVVLEVFDLG